MCACVCVCCNDPSNRSVLSFRETEKVRRGNLQKRYNMEAMLLSLRCSRRPAVPMYAQRPIMIEAEPKLIKILHQPAEYTPLSLFDRHLALTTRRRCRRRRRRRCCHIRTAATAAAQHVVPKFPSKIAIVCSTLDVRSQESILDATEVSFRQVRFENRRLDDEDVAELAEHVEPLVERLEGEGRDRVLIQSKVPVEASAGNRHVSCE